MSVNPASPAIPSDKHHAHHGVGHVVPLKLLVGVFAALVVLTVVTVWVSQLQLQQGALLVAMIVALAKGTLVVLFFMHLLWDRRFNLLVFLGCLGFVTLFISLALLDTKAYQPSMNPGQGAGVEKVRKLNQFHYEEPKPAPAPAPATQK